MWQWIQQVSPAWKFLHSKMHSSCDWSYSLHLQVGCNCPGNQGINHGKTEIGTGWSCWSLSKVHWCTPARFWQEKQSLFLLLSLWAPHQKRWLAWHHLEVQNWKTKLKIGSSTKFCKQLPRNFHLTSQEDNILLCSFKLAWSPWQFWCTTADTCVSWHTKQLQCARPCEGGKRRTLADMLLKCLKGKYTTAQHFTFWGDLPTWPFVDTGHFLMQYWPIW